MPRHTQLGADQSEASISRGDPEPGPMRGRACGHLLSPSSGVSRLSRPRHGWLLVPDSLPSLSAVENLPGWCCERELSISLKVFIAYLLRSNLLFARLNDGITSSLSKLRIFVVFYTSFALRILNYFIWNLVDWLEKSRAYDCKDLSGTRKRYITIFVGTFVSMKQNMKGNTASQPARRVNFVSNI